MDFLKRAGEFVNKYRWAVLILLLGVVLMLIPSSQKDDSAPLITDTTPVTEDMAAKLETILAQIKGVGKVQVLLSLEAGQTTVYRIDEDGTVIVTDADRAQNGLVERVESVIYRGAVIVCQGADSPNVRLNVVEAVASATGLGTDRITVLKMK